MIQNLRSVSRTFILVVLLLAPSPVALEAQNQPRGANTDSRGNRVDTLTAYLSAPFVQKELELTRGVTAKIKSLKEQMELELKELKIREREPVVRQRALQEDYVVKLRQILNPVQWNRVEQITVQLYGAEAFTATEIAPKLGLSDEQRQAIRRINVQYSLTSNRSTVADPNAKDLGEQKLREMEALLTEEQRRKFAEMKGPSFNIKILKNMESGFFYYSDRRTTLEPNRIRLVAQNPIVQKELQLSNEQSHSLYAAWGEFLTRTLENELAKSETSKTTPKDIEERFDLKIRELLSEQQQQRLEQIQSQLRGDDALSDPSVITALNLTAQQISTLDAINAEHSIRPREMLRTNPRPLSNKENLAVNESLAEHQRQRHTQVWRVLTPLQQEQFHRLLGKEFHSQSLWQRRLLSRPVNEYPTMLVNPTFERGFESWNPIVFGAQPRMEPDNEFLHEGKPCLKISTQEPSDTELVQEVALQSGAAYRLRGWVKTQDLAPADASVYGTIQIQTVNGMDVIATGENHQGTSDWSEISLVFEAPRTRVVRVACIFTGFDRGKGSVWFSDLSLQQLTMSDEIELLLAMNKPFDFDFDLKDLTGNELKKNQFQGKVLVVDLWGTWCPPCVAEIPHFIELQKKFGDAGLAIVGLNKEESDADDHRQLVKAFHEERRMNYPCALIPDEFIKTIPDFEAYPTTLLIDRSGNVRLKVVGYQEYSKLESMVQKLLQE